MRASDYVRYSNLQEYVFTTVHQRFHRERCLSAFDFMSIVIWKANRAKSQIAKRLIRMGRDGEDLDAVARRLTRALWDCKEDKDRLRTLCSDWQFRLPMASAILTVCWPDRFTIYDVRVCKELGGFAKLLNISDPERLWEGYCRYLADVRRKSPHRLSFRDCDRYLWGRSAALQLEEDIRRSFSRPE